MRERDFLNTTLKVVQLAASAGGIFWLSRSALILKAPEGKKFGGLQYGLGGGKKPELNNDDTELYVPDGEHAEVWCDRHYLEVDDFRPRQNKRGSAAVLINNRKYTTKYHGVPIKHEGYTMTYFDPQKK